MKEEKNMKNSIYSAVCITVIAFYSAGFTNPAYQVEQVRPPDIEWALGAMDFLSDGRMVVASWTDPYGVYIIDGIEGDPDQMDVNQYASGFVEILGMKVLNDSIYVVTKDNLVLLLDHDGDEVADEYRVLAYDWSRTTNEKNYVFGLPWDGEHFYMAFNGDLVGGATLRVPQPPGRENITWKVTKAGEMERFSGGHRVPAGIEYVYGELWITENQGGYRPSSPLINVRQDRWYARQVEATPLRWLQPYQKTRITPPEDYSPFAAHFMHGATARSPGNPAGIFEGIYAGQLLVPDADDCNEAGTGGIRRVFIEKIDGEIQGCIFHFKRQGEFESRGVWKLKWSPAGNLYAGGNASNCAGWGRVTPRGIDRLTYTGNIPFEMLAIRSLGQDQFEIEFTKALQASSGSDLSGNLNVERFWNQVMDDYGGGAYQDRTDLTVNSAVVSADRMKVTVDLDGIQERRIYHFNWDDNSIQSESGEDMFEDEAWYSLNQYGPGEDIQPLAGCPDARYAEYMANRDVDDQQLCVTLNVEKPDYRLGSGISLEKTAGGVHISLPSHGDYVVAVSNVNGRQLKTFRSQGKKEVVFSTEAFSPGIYLIRVTGQNRTFSRKLVLMK
jgi:cytochrome c